MDNPFWAQWYFHIPNYLLAVVMYSMIGRLIFGMFAPAGWQNYIWKMFVRVTDPVLALTRTVTPGAIQGVLLVAFSIVWLMFLRLALFVIFMPGTGLEPGQGG